MEEEEKWGGGAGRKTDQLNMATSSLVMPASPCFRRMRFIPMDKTRILFNRKVSSICVKNTL